MQVVGGQVPEQVFEDDVRKGATKTEILNHVPKKKPVDVLRGRDPEMFKVSMYGCGALSEFVKEVAELSPKTVAAMTLATDYPAVRAKIKKVRQWLAALETAMKKGGWRT